MSRRGRLSQADRRRGSNTSDPISCGRSIKSPQRAHTLQQIVRNYLSDYAEEAERELRFYRIQRTLKDTIVLAALAKLPSGKRHPHQRRIPTLTLESAKERLLGADLGGCKTFDDLHTAVRSSIGAIRGIADLTIYDTSLRIGAKLGLEPDRVYLHAGTREGARALRLDYRRQFLELSTLPKPLRRLKPREIEDCLCRFEKELRAIRAFRPAEKK